MTLAVDEPHTDREPTAEESRHPDVRSRNGFRPADPKLMERRMEEHNQPIPERRAADERDELMPPRTDADVKAAPQPRLAREANLEQSGLFEPPVSAIGPLFRHRLERIRRCRVSFDLDINTRPTARVLGGYYKSRWLVRVYSHDRVEGRRPLEELFATFLHEVAHHLEYTEPHMFGSRWCRRVPGLMHSRLFWRILGELKWRWVEVQSQRPI
jgi:hypothetical protein